MLRNGCKNSSIIAAIGPCIKQNSYNVKEDFKKSLSKKIKIIKYFLKLKKMSFISICLILLNLNLNQTKL